MGDLDLQTVIGGVNSWILFRFLLIVIHYAYSNILVSYFLGVVWGFLVLVLVCLGFFGLVGWLLLGCFFFL